MQVSRFSDDVDLLRQFVSRWWSNREVHEREDAVRIDDVFDRLLGIDAQTRTQTGRAVALREHVWSLMDGHLRLAQMRDRSDVFYASGLGCTAAGEGIVVTSVEPALTAVSGCQCGDLVVEVENEPVASYLASVRLRPGSSPWQRRWHAVESLVWQQRVSDERIVPTRLTVEAPSGSRRSVPLTWRRFDERAPTPACVTARMITPAVGLMRVQSFVCRDQMGQVNDAEFLRQAQVACAQLQNATHLIVDVRRNGGGRDEQARILASLLTYSPMEWMRYQRPDRNTAEDAGGTKVSHLNPEDQLTTALRQVETRPSAGASCWLLVGPGCASTAEIFVSALRAGRGATLVGERTAGSVGDPVTFLLPHSLLPVWVPTARYFSPGTGTPIERIGIEPDVHAALSRADVLRSADPAIDAVLSMVR